MTRTDAPLSVQRAFTLDEWRDLFERAGIGPFRLFPKFPFRQMTLISILERNSAARLPEDQNDQKRLAGSSPADCDADQARM
jgi:hypothetical protein